MLRVFVKPEYTLMEQIHTLWKNRAMAKQPIRPDSKEAIAERLTLTREAMGMKQADFCRLVGITPQAWNNYEEAVNRISIDAALKVVQATGISLDWIYRGYEALLPQHIAQEIRRIRDLRSEQ
ncbi:DNA-binding XRE family transcriptional regulator [Microvirga flocculans]|uniref:DNA-binding XRE family transcriptional regulator n=1 Tax=Microvirga flocculans TaxID=217168 RepID=A0A7W6IIC7_9HYPH|nr:helix-turn-helix transcriptional regulator [Microvirga flocculans]MBB4042037.1 DNA-binding XRE family transcriptional regulator [Microvirga flocculans]